MNPVSLSPGEMWRLALEVIVTFLVVSAIAAALASALLLGLAGLVTEWLPKLRARLRSPLALPLPSERAGVPR